MGCRCRSDDAEHFVGDELLDDLAPPEGHAAPADRMLQHCGVVVEHDSAPAGRQCEVEGLQPIGPGHPRAILGVHVEQWRREHVVCAAVLVESEFGGQRRRGDRHDLFGKELGGVVAGPSGVADLDRSVEMAVVQRVLAVVQPQPEFASAQGALQGVEARDHELLGEPRWHGEHEDVVGVGNVGDGSFQLGERAEKYGDREWSPNVIRRLEDAAGVSVTAPGFPAELLDDEPEERGAEVVVRR